MAGREPIRMSLHAWQTRLWDMVIAQSSGAPTAPDRVGRLERQLSDTERRWLGNNEMTSGFKLVCDIQRRWREFRLETATPLTVSALGPERRQEVVGEFIRRHPTSSIFFMSEALPFFDIAAEMAADVPHLAELVAFERSRLLLGEALASGHAASGDGEMNPSDKLATHPLASVVRFHAPPERVIAAAMRGQCMPPREERNYWLLIAPRLPNLARVCDTAQAQVFEVLRETPATPESFHGDPVALAAMTGLWQAGALRAVA
jgi:hypothetical protein